MTAFAAGNPHSTRLAVAARLWLAMKSTSGWLPSWQKRRQGGCFGRKTAATHQQGEASPAWQLTREFFTLLHRDPGRVVVLTLEWQIERLLAQGHYAPFALAIGR